MRLNILKPAAGSKTDPNDNLTGPIYGGNVVPMAGLMYNAGDKQSRSGNAIYLGGRYDIASSGTKIGALAASCGREKARSLPVSSAARPAARLISARSSSTTSGATTPSTTPSSATSSTIRCTKK